jgi:PAS domain S-box-containing protein
MPRNPGLTQELKELTYRIVFEESRELKFIIDQDGIILNANNALADFFGKQPEDFHGLNIYSLLVREVAAERKKHADEAFLTGKRQVFEDYSNGRFFRNFLYPVNEENGTCNKLYVFAQDVTEVKLSEKQTNKYAAFSREAMEAFPGPFAVLNPQGDIITSNSCFRQVIAGKEEHELSDMNAFDLIHPDDKTLVYEKLTEILQNDTEEAAEIRILIHGGAEYGWFRISTKKMVIDDDVFLVSIGTDITAHKQKEEELSISNEQLRFILSESRTGGWDWDVKNNSVKWTDEIWELYGFDKNSCEPAYESWKKSVVEDDRKKLEPKVLAASRKGLPFRVEWCVRYADGSLHWLMSRGIPFKGADGSVSRYVGIVIDITDLKEAEQRHNASEERFRRLFEEHSSLMLIIDAENDTILDANKAAEAFYGLNSKELCGMTIEHLSTNSPETLRINKERIWSRNQRKFLSEHRLSDGSLRDVEVFCTPDIFMAKPVFYCIINDITDRRLAEKQTFESKAKLDAALESMNDALFIFDAETQLVEYNTAYALFLKFSDKKECIKKVEMLQNIPAFFEVSMPDGTPAPLDQWAIPRALRGEVCTNVEYHVRRKDTSEQWIGSYNFAPIRNREGKIVGAVTTARDITHHKKAEAALKESEERFRKFFEQHSAVMMILDPENGKIIDVNHAAVEYYGWSREQLRDMNITEINTDKPEDTLKTVDGWRNAETRTYTVTHRKADGSICDIEVFGQKIRVQERWLAYLILHDITERKQFQQALVESNERMHLILNTTNAGVWDTDTTTFESTWSNEIWRLYGLESCSCKPSFENWINTIVPEDRAMVKQAVAEAVNNATEYNCSWRVRSSDDTIHWLMSKGNPIRDASGKVVKYVGITLDNTEQKREEAEIKRLEARIRRSERLETIGTLAGGIAHDLNNILTPILGYAELGMLTLPEEDELHQYLTEITLAAERAKSLVYQILTFGKAQESEPSIMSMQSIIDEALKLMRPSIPATISIEKHIDSSCRNILADPSKIGQVIVNLCTNAYQAMENSGGILSIELKEVVPDSKLLKMFSELHELPYARLTITDTGYGMDKITMDRIFEPFFTTKTVNKGTGLGLSVVHGIITIYNGIINVESQQGIGSSFQIYLPVIDKNITGKEKKKVVMSGKGRLLIVDDEPAILNMITMMLTKFGYRIHTLNSPIQALDLFRQSPGEFDLLITDLTMPEMTGIKLASEIHSYRPELPVILMTGYGKEIERASDLEKYGIRLLLKPVKAENLVSVINEVLYSN